MVNLYARNKTGTVGTTVSAQMKREGYIAGASAEWEKHNGKWVLRLVSGAELLSMKYGGTWKLVVPMYKQKKQRGGLNGK